jgi:hypothetical protein
MQTTQIKSVNSHRTSVLFFSYKKTTQKPVSVCVSNIVYTGDVVQFTQELSVVHTENVWSLHKL